MGDDREAFPRIERPAALTPNGWRDTNEPAREALEAAIKAAIEVNWPALAAEDKRAWGIRAAGLKAAGGDPHHPASATAMRDAGGIEFAARKEFRRAFRDATESARKAYDAATKPYDAESNGNIDRILRMGALDPYIPGYLDFLWLSTDDQGIAVYRDSSSGIRYRSAVTEEFVIGGTCLMCGKSLPDPKEVRCATC